MKASKLVAELLKLINSHGDLEVKYLDMDLEYLHISTVDYDEFAEVIEVSNL